MPGALDNPRRSGAGAVVALGAGVACCTRIAHAQATSAGRASTDAFVWAIVLIGVVLVGFTIVFVVRKRALAKGDDSAAQEGFMGELRRLRDSGLISPEEFDATRRTMARKLADKVSAAAAARAQTHNATSASASQARRPPGPQVRVENLGPGGLRPEQLDDESLRELEELRARALARRAAAQNAKGLPPAQSPPTKASAPPPSAPPTPPQQPPTPRRPPPTPGPNP